LSELVRTLREVVAVLIESIVAASDAVNSQKRCITLRGTWVSLSRRGKLVRMKDAEIGTSNV
jgi:hypothetical protein